MPAAAFQLVSGIAECEGSYPFGFLGCAGKLEEGFARVGGTTAAFGGCVRCSYGTLL